MEPKGEFQAAPVRVENTAALVGLFLVAFVIFAGAAGAMIWHAAFGEFASIPETAPAVRGMLALVSLFPLALAWQCWGPLRHALRPLAFDDQGVVFGGAGTAAPTPWSELRWRVNEVAQTLTLSTRDGASRHVVSTVALNVVPLVHALSSNAASGMSGKAGSRPAIVFWTGGWLHAALAAVAIPGGLAILWLVDPESGIPPSAALHAAEGRIAWVDEHSSGVRFGLVDHPAAFRYPDKSNAADRVYRMLSDAGDDSVAIRFESTAIRSRSFGRPLHDVWEIAVDGRDVRTYTETTTAWRDDNSLAPWLGGFFALTGVFLGLSAWHGRLLRRHYCASRP